MLELIIEIIIESLIELLLPLLIELLGVLGFDSVANAFKEKKSSNRYLALFGCLLIGSILGLLSYFIYSKRIVTGNPYPGIGVIISPIIVGFIMKKWGEMRKEKDKRGSILTTFWGGALLAFSYSLVRFLLMQ